MSSSEPLLSVRTAVVLLLAAVIGIAAGCVGFLAYRDVAIAVLIGGGAAGGALPLFHALLSRY